ncbi:serine hydrolase [Rhodococcus sp. 06-462-5]|uniref:serine hydrolase n=1 Tax=unclassified Rhodococcus (in: high G+C Gram-positive bacteria) TaxID=192944 RepID=UPI000B9B46FE|nr:MULTISPECIES: serine hydrolase [unclassified Rhodococcus (in: high G+C Gram-positive bacteria)]OZC68338.1 serine hydrolase [Rhodococcus sp. 06-462-5]OZE66182.1 serine hydrolase [Rhodococcus sp. 02-925g]
MSATEHLRAVFADAGCRGWVRAERTDGTGTFVDFEGDDPVVAASVWKIVLLVATTRAFDDGTLIPTDTVRLVPAQCSPGPTGIASYADPVTMSWRDVARSMITVSDNAAADALLGALGMDTLTRVIDDLGLEHTRIVGGTKALGDQIVRDTGRLSADEALGLLASNYTVIDSAGFDPAYTSCTTPRDSNAVLRAIWSGTAASPEQCEYMKHVLSQQVWPHRIRSGIPYPDVQVAGKTGTIGPIRNEVAVVSFPGEKPVAVSVYTRAARMDLYLPLVDQAIGAAARIAVTAVR